jgi:hypothetical protein
MRSIPYLWQCLSVRRVPIQNYDGITSFHFVWRTRGETKERRNNREQALVPAVPAARALSNADTQPEDTAEPERRHGVSLNSVFMMRTTQGKLVIAKWPRNTRSSHNFCFPLNVSIFSLWRGKNYIHYTSTLKMEASCLSDMLVTIEIYKTTRLHNPDDHNLNSHRRENLKSQLHKLLIWNLLIISVLRQICHIKHKISYRCHVDTFNIFHEKFVSRPIYHLQTRSHINFWNSSLVNDIKRKVTQIRLLCGCHVAVLQSTLTRVAFLDLFIHKVSETYITWYYCRSHVISLQGAMFILLITRNRTPHNSGESWSRSQVVRKCNIIKISQKSYTKMIGT